MVSPHGGWENVSSSHNWNWIICHRWRTFEQPIWWLAKCFFRSVAELNTCEHGEHGSQIKQNMTPCPQNGEHWACGSSKVHPTETISTHSAPCKYFHVTIVENLWKLIKTSEMLCVCISRMPYRQDSTNYSSKNVSVGIGLRENNIWKGTNQVSHWRDVQRSLTDSFLRHFQQFHLTYGAA